MIQSFSRRKKILRVPDVIWKSPKSVVKEFIRGLFEADGTVGRTNCSFTSKDSILVKEIQILLMGFGIKSKFSSGYNKTYKRYYYTLYLGRQACDIFSKEINFISIGKKAKLKIITERKHSNAYKEWELNDEIIEIEIGENDVYDIQIPDGEYYLANGIVSHNSNIKALEYTALGAPGIYSDVEPYSDCVVKAKTDEEFISEIEKMEDINYRETIFNKSLQRVQGQLWWEENENLKKYINTYLNLFGHKLP